MPSWQSYILDPVMRWQVKRKLARAKTPAEARAAFGGAMLVPKGATYTPAMLGGVAGEWVRTGGAVFGTMLYLHGGGYFSCSAKTHRPVTTAYALRGLTVFAADYRLAPENPFPAALDDALAAYRALLDSGVAPEKLTLAGDSAGGGLALALLLAAKDAGLPMPACAAVFSPWTDLAITGTSVQVNRRRDALLDGRRMGEAADFYLNGADARNPLISPLYGDLAGLPPLLIHVGEPEILLDDSVRLAAAARQAGVPVTLKVWDNTPHGWQLAQGFLPEARASLDEATAFAKAHLV
jgi:acetyl esterase/lipase